MADLGELFFNRKLKKLLMPNSKKVKTKAKAKARARATYRPPSSFYIGGVCLEDKLKAHKRWVDSDGSEGERLEIENADLHGCDLSEQVFFRARLIRCDISQANLRSANFWGADLSYSIFWQSDLEGAVLVGADATYTDMSGANLRHMCSWGADFKHSNWRGCDISGADVSYSDFNDVAELGSVKYSRKTTLNHVKATSDTWDTNLPMRKQWETQNFLLTFKKNHPFLFWLWKITCNCGESIGRWILLNFTLLVIYSLVITANPGWIDLGSYDSVFSPFYYSFVTFVTLGYGDFLPTCWQGQILAIIISASGYMSLGGLITIFSKKIVI